jgi:hypothetical protein
MSEGNNKMLTDKQARNVLIYYQYGYTYGQISERVDGIRFSDIRRTIKNFKEGKSVAQGVKTPEEIRDNAIELYKHGVSRDDICRTLNLGKGAVGRIITKYRKDKKLTLNPENIKKEPATDETAADTDINVKSTDIIVTDNLENVKSFGKIPELVFDIVADRVRKLTQNVVNNKLKIMQFEESISEIREADYNTIKEIHSLIDFIRSNTDIEDFFEAGELQNYEEM